MRDFTDASWRNDHIASGTHGAGEKTVFLVPLPVGFLMVRVAVPDRLTTTTLVRSLR